MPNNNNLLVLSLLSAAPGLLFGLLVSTIDPLFWLVFPIIVLICSVNLGFLFVALFAFITDSRLQAVSLPYSRDELSSSAERAIWANLGAAATSILALCLFFALPASMRATLVSVWLSLSIFGFTATGQVVFTFLGLARALASPQNSTSGFRPAEKRA